MVPFGYCAEIMNPISKLHQGDEQTLSVIKAYTLNYSGKVIIGTQFDKVTIVKRYMSLRVHRKKILGPLTRIY